MISTDPAPAERSSRVAPLAGGATALSSAQIEEARALVRAELDKLEELGGERPDFELVSETAARVLATGRPDLLCATWLGVARAALAQWEGVAEALARVQELLEAHADTLLPERPRARGAALDYLFERLILLLETNPAPGATLPAIAHRVDGIAGSLTDEVAEHAPALRALRDALARATRDAQPSSLGLEPTGTSPSGTTVTPVKADEPTAPAAAARSAVASPTDEPISFLVARAHELRRDAPHASWPYVLLRRALALRPPSTAKAVDERPPSDAGPASFANIHALERAVESTPGSLDAHFRSRSALASEGLGDAAESIDREVAAMLVRDRTLSTQAISDPARRWVASLLPRDANATPNEQDALERKARAVLGAGDDQGFAALVAASRASAPTRRAEWVQLLALAEIALDEGRAELAVDALSGGLAVAEVPAERWDEALFRGIFARLLEAVMEAPTHGGLAESAVTELRAKLAAMAPQRTPIGPEGDAPWA